MRKNVASQHIGFALVVASTGAALVGATASGFVSKDGAQSALGGAFTGLGSGQYDYAPTQAETNANELSFFFTAATAVPVEKTIYTTAADPSDAAKLGLTNLDAAISTRAVESTVAKEATLNTKVPTALSFSGANVNAESKITAAPSGMALDSTVAKDSTVSKETTLTTKIPTALSFSGANVNAEAKVTAAPSDMALNSTVAKDATVMKTTSYAAPDNTGIGQINARLPTDPADASDVAGLLSSLSAAVGTRAAPGDAMVLTAGGVDAILDEIVVSTYTMRQLLKVFAAALAGKASGGGTTTITFRGIDDASNVIVATVDADGNRSVVTVTV